MPRRTTGVLAAAGLAVGISHALAGPIEVIYCKKVGHPKAALPGWVDFSGNPIGVEWKALDGSSVAANGARWAVDAQANHDSMMNTGIVVGSGMTGSVLNLGGVRFSEGQPAPEGGFWDFIGSGFVRYDSSANMVLGMRVRTAQALNPGSTTGTAAADGQRVYRSDGSSLALAFKQLDVYTGLMDGGTGGGASGDETVGNSVTAWHLLDDGRIGSQDGTVGNISTTKRPVLTYADPRPIPANPPVISGFKQSNTTAAGGPWLPAGGTAVLDMDGITPVQVYSHSVDFYTSPNGLHWVGNGRRDTSTGPIMLIVDNQIRLQNNVAIGGSGVTPTSFLEPTVTNSGDWYVRGASAGGPYVVKNGSVIAKVGDPVTPGADERWNTFLSISANETGDFLLVGTTDRADTAANEVAVLNGTDVVMREGDPIDLDGNGLFDDRTWIGRGTVTLVAFGTSWNITNNRTIYGIIHVRDAAGGGGADVTCYPAFGTPQAFVRRDVSGTLPTGKCCFGDGSCQVLTEGQCTSRTFGGFGIYGGDGTTCAAPCELGACCRTNASCVSMPEAQCLAEGGTWTAATPCASVTCTASLSRACCLPEGRCLVRTEAVCATYNGVWNSAFTTCVGPVCPGAYYESNPTDSGELPGTAAEASGSGRLIRIEGSNNATTDTDMYRIQVCDRAVFSASMSDPLTANLAGSSGNPMMVIFDENGVAVALNDNDATMNPTFTGSARITNELVLTNGTYYVAVSRYGISGTNARLPQSAGGQIFALPSGTPPGHGTTQVAPAGPGAASAVSSWAGTATGTGTYAIVLTGACLVQTGTAGGCCLPDQTCAFTTAGECASLNGVYQGDAVSCSAVNCATPVCYANCDQSTASPVLNVADFTCFLQKYAAADLYANCDESTAPPVLNVADFTCFLQKYAGGCP